MCTRLTLVPFKGAGITHVLVAVQYAHVMHTVLSTPADPLLFFLLSLASSGCVILYLHKSRVTHALMLTHTVARASPVPRPKLRPVLIL